MGSLFLYFIVIFLTAPLSSLILALPHHTATRVKAPAEEIPPEYLKALRAFNRQNVQAPSFSNFDRSRNAVFSDPISLATLWAVVNERAFDIETVEIHRALGLVSEEIPRVYASINNFLNQNNSVLTTNAVFTRRSDIELTAGLERLHTIVETRDFREENSRLKVAQAVNSYVANHTENEINMELLPQLDAPMEKSTDSVVLSTTSYRRTFSRPLTLKPDLQFRAGPGETVMTDSVETMGSYQVYETDNWTAVVIPVDATELNNVIVVQSKDLEHFLENDFETFSRKVDTISRYTSTKFPFFQKRNLRVQIPTLNLTVARRFLQEVEPVAETKLPQSQSAICDTTTERREFLQTPVQVSRIRLSPESLSVATVIGVQVENVKEYRKELGVPASPGVQPQSAEDIVLTTEHPEVGQVSEKAPVSQVPAVENSYRSNNDDTYIPVHIQREAKHESGNEGPLVQRHGDHGVSVDLAYQDIVLNTPFFVALHEYNVGMYNFLAVRNPLGTPGEAEDFSEYAKLKRWVCLAPPAPLPPHSQ